VEFENILPTLASELEDVSFYYSYSDSDLLNDWNSLIKWNARVDSMASTQRVGMKLCEHFFPNFFDIENKDGNSFKSLWKADKLEKVLRWNRKSHSTPYLSELRRGIYFNYKLAKSTMYRPQMAKMVVTNLGAKRVLDPCAGWGNRLLVAYVLNYEYEATDPGVTFEGLKRIQKFLGSGYDIQNKKWQDYDWKKSDFILTSPPFYNKEDYLDGVNFGTYEKWESAFFMPLIRKCKVMVDRVVLHVDNTMLASIKKEYDTSDIKLYSVNRHKAPNEWFTEIKDRITHD
jgi:hypothetical protein